MLVLTSSVLPLDPVFCYTDLGLVVLGTTYVLCEIVLGVNHWVRGFKIELPFSTYVLLFSVFTVRMESKYME